MFIAWRQRPVKCDKRTPYLQDANPASDLATPWKPLYCEHRGTDRVAWTPFLMHAERVDGEPRQEMLHRFPTIRSCCIAESFHRAAWWYDVERTIAGWREFRVEPMYGFLDRDEPALLAKLREVVPPPLPSSIRAFTAYRLERERAHKRLWDRINEKKRQQAEEHRRRQEQGRFIHSGSVISTDCFTVLDLEPTATIDEVKRRYRELAMRHHPDRGGNDGDFVRITEAYEHALQSLVVRI